MRIIQFLRQCIIVNDFLAFTTESLYFPEGNYNGPETFQEKRNDGADTFHEKQNDRAKTSYAKNMYVSHSVNIINVVSFEKYEMTGLRFFLG